MQVQANRVCDNCICLINEFSVVVGSFEFSVVVIAVLLHKHSLAIHGLVVHVQMIAIVCIECFSQMYKT